jgi:hypothetical protein
MKKTITLSFTVLLPFFFLTCGKSLPTLEAVDLALWAEDKNACQGKRAQMEDALRIQQQDLMGLTEMQIVTLFGRPDDNELYKRNQKFYHYFIQPGKPCSPTGEENPRELIIRFTAMGIVNEVSIE